MHVETTARKRLALTCSSAFALLAADSLSAQTFDTLSLGNVILTYEHVTGSPYFRSFVSATNETKEKAYDFHLIFEDPLGHPVGPSYNFTLKDFPNGNPILRKGTFTFPDPINQDVVGYSPVAWWTGPEPDHKIIESKLPEPSSWVQMLLGFGFIGVLARRRVSGTRRQLVRR